MQKTRVRSLGWEDPLEKGKAGPEDTTNIHLQLFPFNLDSSCPQLAFLLDWTGMGGGLFDEMTQTLIPEGSESKNQALVFLLFCLSAHSQGTPP